MMLHGFYFFDGVVVRNVFWKHFLKRSEKLRSAYEIFLIYGWILPDQSKKEENQIRKLDKGAKIIIADIMILWTRKKSITDLVTVILQVKWKKREQKTDTKMIEVTHPLFKEKRLDHL